MSFTERVAAYFKAHPDTWLDGLAIAEVGGRYAYRARISDCRKELGMTILNRQRKVRTVDGGPHDFFVISEYKFVPEKAA